MEQNQLERELRVWRGVTLESTVVASADQLSAQLGDEVILLNLKTGVYFGVSEVAARIWELLDTPRTCASIAATIFEEFDMEQAQIESDVLSFVHQLKDFGLVDVRR